MKTREGVLLLALLIGAGIYLLVNGDSFPPSADAQEPVAVACLKRAGFKVESDTYEGRYETEIHYELDVEEDGESFAIIYLGDLDSDAELMADELKDSQKTYGDYKGETIEQRGTAVIRLADGSRHGAAVHRCVDLAKKAKED